jgi:RHS repeat-associated protein
LGNVRIASLIGNQTVGADMAYAPYGEVYNQISGSNIDVMFTGDLTQLDAGVLFDTPNREFAASNQGRWLSPDPAGVGWNQYAYGTNPNGGADPSGLAWTDFSGQIYGYFDPLELQQAADGVIGINPGGASAAITLCFCPNDVTTSGVTLSSTFDMGIAVLNTMATIFGWMQSGLQYVANSGAGCGDGTLNCYVAAGAIVGSIDTIALIGSGLNVGADIATSNSMALAPDLESGAVFPTVSGGSQASDLANILMPGGSPIGVAGSSDTVRVVQGNLGDAQALFNQISQDGTPVLNTNYPGQLVSMPNGGYVGLRTVMTNSPGTDATIDVNMQGIVPFTKIKFTP